MLGDVCAKIKNFFTYEDDKHIGDFVIENGVLSPSLDFPTDYIRIIGSRLNNGVHKVSEMTLRDEAFHGAVWIMSPPDDFLALVAEMESAQEKYGGVDSAAMSPFNSESWGGYYYLKSGNNTSGKTASTGYNVFSAYESRLNLYRKIKE